MVRHTTEQIMTTVEDAHNIADMKNSMFPDVKNCSEIQGQTRQQSKLISLLEVEQNCIFVKMDCDLSNEMKIMSIKDFIEENTKNPQDIWSEFDRASRR